MNFQQKRAILKEFQTKELAEKIDKAIDRIHSLEVERLEYVAKNRSWLSGKGGDCDTVRQREAELLLEFIPGEKKTAKEREAALLKQTTEDKTHKGALALQQEVATRIKQFDVSIERERNRYGAMVALLNLRTAQIRFLGGE